MKERISRARSALFVPATRPDRVLRAVQSGADAVIVDLEDALAAEEKEGARAAAYEAFAEGRFRAEVPVLLRINHPDSPWGAGDLEAFRAGPDTGRPDGILLPECARPGDVQAVVHALGDELPVVAMIESARGVAAAREIAAHPAVGRLAMGLEDLRAELRCAGEAAAVHAVLAETVLASAWAGLPAPLASPCTEYGDPAAAQEHSGRMRREGFGGCLCIHPVQIEPTHRGLQPDREELEWARRVAGAGTSAVGVGGQMVDRPVLARARHLLQMAGEDPGGNQDSPSRCGP